MRWVNRWPIGGWVFYQVEDHGMGLADLEERPLFAYSIGDASKDNGEPRVGEFYNSLEHAMVAAVGEKFTGPRGAGGSGVATAADWFMRMVGADQLVPVDRPADVLAQALLDAEGFPPVSSRGFARRVADNLERHGHTVARMND